MSEKFINDIDAILETVKNTKIKIYTDEQIYKIYFCLRPLVVLPYVAFSRQTGITNDLRVQY